MQRLNQAVARRFRRTASDSINDTVQPLEVEPPKAEAKQRVEQSKWSMSSVALTIRPPKLPASVDFGAAMPGSRSVPGWQGPKPISPRPDQVLEQILF